MEMNVILRIDDVIAFSVSSLNLRHAGRIPLVVQRFILEVSHLLYYMVIDDMKLPRNSCRNFIWVSRIRGLRPRVIWE